MGLQTFLDSIGEKSTSKFTHMVVATIQVSAGY